MKVWHVGIVILVLSCITSITSKALVEDTYTGGKLVSDKDATISKRAASLLDNDDHYFKSHQKYKRRRSPFGLVYKDGKPIGILEPISRIYEFQNFQDEPNSKNSFNKRELDVNPNTVEDTYVKRDIDRLENDNVLRSFRMNPHQPVMDDSSAVKGEQKRSVIPKDQVKGDSKLSAIENNLKEIISDLNTISADDEDSEVDKREVMMEDEDLDNGANKIGLTKETHGKQSDGKGISSEMSNKSKKSVDVKSNKDILSDETKKIADYRSEGETFIRQKRQQASSSKQDVNDIVKGLEASGDLTVSGNKSPLASASAPVESENKKTKSFDFEKREKQSEDSDYEKRLQRNIQNKISEIKEQVKREIQALASKKNVPVQNPDSGLSKDINSLKQVVQDKSINVHEPVAKVRQKRNLLEQDSEDIDIAQNTEAESLQGHIRQKRSFEDDVDDSKVVDNAPKSDDLKEQSVVLDKTKRSDGRDLGFGHDHDQPTSQNAAAAINPAVASQAAVFAHATGDLTPIANAASDMNAEQLAKLVKESATLTESIRSERAANLVRGPHIEVELHDGEDPGIANEDRDEKTNKLNSGPPASLAEDHASASNLIVKRSTRTKQNVEKKKTFRTEDGKEGKTKIEETEAVSDNSPAAASNTDEYKYKSYKASTKLLPRVTEEESKVDAYTESAENANLEGDDARTINDQEKQEQIMDISKIAEAHNGNDNGYKSSEDGDLNKRASNQENKVRQERESQPGMSLDDLQAMENENSMRRRRRRRYIDEYDDYNARDKRADYEMPPSMPFRNYRGDEDEADDENDEFDDDNFDDRTANLVRKRAAQQQQQMAYEDADADYDALGANRMGKRNINARDYVAQMNDDVYDNSNYLYDANGRPLNRNKRQIMEKNGNLAALHGGGPMMNHLAAIRGRNAHLDADPRDGGKRLGKSFHGGAVKNDETISVLSDSDVFGALPQSFEGELTRFKRVKRDDPAG